MRGMASTRVLALFTLLAGVCASAAVAAPAGHGRPGRPDPSPPAASPRGPGAPAAGYSETHFGLTCTWSGGFGGYATCARADGTGLQVAVSRRLVVVRSAGGKIVFWRAQPRRSRRPPPAPTASVAYSHSDGNVACQWSTASGGGALCRAADGRGYTAGVLSTVAVVISDSSNIVFIGKQQ